VRLLSRTWSRRRNLEDGGGCLEVNDAVQLTLIFQEKLALLVEIDAVAPDAAELGLDFPYFAVHGWAEEWGGEIWSATQVSSLSARHVWFRRNYVCCGEKELFF
jgi:hypothetical protein